MVHRICWKPEQKMPEINQLLDHILSVESVGVFKPSPKVYQMVLDKLKVNYQNNLLFFSSNQWDVIGAAHFGLQAVWVNKYNQVQESLKPKAKYTISSLADLPKMLQNL